MRLDPLAFRAQVQGASRSYASYLSEDQYWTVSRSHFDPMSLGVHEPIVVHSAHFIYKGFITLAIQSGKCRYLSAYEDNVHMVIRQCITSSLTRAVHVSVLYNSFALSELSEPSYTCGIYG
jgi:hypothetical protein